MGFTCFCVGYCRGCVFREFFCGFGGGGGVLLVCGWGGAVGCGWFMGFLGLVCCLVLVYVTWFVGLSVRFFVFRGPFWVSLGLLSVKGASVQLFSFTPSGMRVFSFLFILHLRLCVLGRVLSCLIDRLGM